ncbi:hypothetical protein I317_03276 [Kwoniella heveanensis CBS 569]|nr:hypothetical protein I317_03276 [Kwoniella heveanensis CBS 569]
MSASSATTLISPSNARTPSAAGTSTHGATGPGMHRRPSTHAHAAHGHHTVKRRASAHAHGHGHGHGHVHGTGRRPSEGDHGRRALAAGLQMHALDTTDALRKQKKKADRPLPKSSRSDTNLPRLSRTTSMTSNASHSSEASRTTTSTTNTGHATHQNKPRPRRNSHVKSEESVHVLDENGQATEEIDDEEGGGWESGDLEISPEKSKKGKMRDPANTRSTVSATMRRAASDSTVEPSAAGNKSGGKNKSTNHPTISGVLGDGNLVDTPSNINGPHPPPLTQRTTGFAGGVQPLDPQIAAQLPAADPHPIVTPHPIRRNTSAKSLVGPIAMEPVQSDQGVPTEPPKIGNDNDDQGEADKQPSRPANGPLRHRSTEGSGLPQGREDTSSPSYPFPQMPPPDQSDKDKQSDAPVPSAGEQPKQSHRRNDSQQEQPQHPSRATTYPQPQKQSQSSSQPRSRQTSSQNGPHPPLRHRYSNSSLRSIQSLRAPPHPLNSPTAYRTASSRPGSMFGSPTKGKGGRDTGRSERERVHSMHQPPVPAPQVSYEVAQGQGWDVGIPEEDTPRRSINEMGAGPAAGTAKKRQDSVSSTRSIRSIFAGTMSNPGGIAPSLSQQGEVSASSRLQSASRQRVSTQQSQNQGSDSAQPRLSRRQTAMEAASAASKMATTSDPALYHHSQGHSSTTAESCFLVSRFLPFKKIERPRWEMDMRDPLVHEELEAGNLKVGLTNGDYRQAHESLVRSIRQLGLNSGVGVGAGNGAGGDAGNNINGANGFGKRGVSRSYSGYNMLTHDTVSHVNGHGGSDGAGLGTIKGKDGVGMTVTRGAFGGKTPFEMSVQRCLTQRPGGRVGL